MGARDVLRKPFNCEEFVMVLTLTLNTYDLPREVCIRRPMTERLSRRLEDLRRLIAGIHQRPNRISRIQEQVPALRELNDKRLAILEGFLDRIWQRAKMADARLDMAQQRLIVMRQKSREGCLRRITCENA
jgi:hypothetical protein